MKMSRKNGSVNVAAMARKICGIKDGVKVGEMSVQQRRDFWNVSKAFEKTNKRAGLPKARTGYGMKIIEKFVMAH